MGYEVVYYYQEKNGKDYDDNIKSFKKRLGDPYEEYPLEELSKSILLQLARRDIYVKDLEIYEITKKKIKYKETKNGIILKNKKYLFSEEGLGLVVESENAFVKDEEDQKLNTTPVQAPVASKGPTTTKSTGRVIKRMNFVPEPQQQIELLQKGIKLTSDKIYSIESVEPHPNGVNEIYTLVDDKGKLVKVSDLFFIPVTNLIGQQDSEDEFKEDKSLNWSGLIQDSIPSIRRG